MRSSRGNREAALDFACAIEMIHAYTLIHDDLPAMDDDDYRRGKLANHKVFGEGIAILAGDALLTYAYEVLSSMAGVDSKAALRIINEVSTACGSQGLIGGQVVDLESEGQEIDLLTLEYIHRHKTGKLFSAALRGGAIIGGADEDVLAELSLYGENFGLAFQITDDILDVSGDIAKLGKATGADLRKGNQPQYLCWDWKKLSCWPSRALTSVSAMQRNFQARNTTWQSLLSMSSSVIRSLIEDLASICYNRDA